MKETVLLDRLICSAWQALYDYTMETYVFRTDLMTARSLPEGSTAASNAAHDTRERSAVQHDTVAAGAGLSTVDIGSTIAAHTESALSTVEPQRSSHRPHASYASVTRGATSHTASDVIRSQVNPAVLEALAEIFTAGHACECSSLIVETLPVAAGCTNNIVHEIPKLLAAVDGSRRLMDVHSFRSTDDCLPMDADTAGDPRTSGPFGTMAHEHFVPWKPPPLQHASVPPHGCHSTHVPNPTSGPLTAAPTPRGRRHRGFNGSMHGPHCLFVASDAAHWHHASAEILLDAANHPSELGSRTHTGEGETPEDDTISVASASSVSAISSASAFSAISAIDASGAPMTPKSALLSARHATGRNLPRSASGADTSPTRQRRETSIFQPIEPPGSDRRRLLVVLAVNDVLCVAAYNVRPLVAKAVYDSLARKVAWQNKRKHFLVDVLHTKMGLFHHAPALSQMVPSTPAPKSSSEVHPHGHCHAVHTCIHMYT